MSRLMFRRLLATCACYIAFVSVASAGLLPVNVTVTPESGKFRWTYAIVLPTDSQIRSGDFFTIYDFAGYLPGSNNQPLNWTFTAANVGPTPDFVLPTDNPSVPNLSWQYTGPTVTAGQVGLGNFWAVSDYGVKTDSFFTARTHRTSDGNIDTNITNTTVPVPAPAVPEPTTLVLAGMGLPILGWLRRRKNATKK